MQVEMNIDRQYQISHSFISLQMKKVIEIDRDIVSNSQETILDDPEKFQAFIWSFGKEMHTGVHRWN